MNIGEIIKKLRKQKDMTQEELAEYLKISPQAVSRWEINSTMPDITLIPMLANIFDVSADVLLGIDITTKEKCIQDITENAKEYSANGYFEKAVEILREGLKEYPTSFKIMHELMYSVIGEKSDDSRKEIISIGEKILGECTENDYRHGAIRLLCLTYPAIGEIDKAVQIAEKMPDAMMSRQNLLGLIYSGTKKFNQIRDNLLGDIDSVIGNMNTTPALDDGSDPHTTKELIIIYKKVIAMLEIMFEDGNYGGYTRIVAWRYTDIAIFYAKINDFENAIENLRIAAEHSIKSDEESNPDKEYTCLLFRGKKIGGVSHYVTENNSMHQLKEMKDSIFDPIRDNKDFIEIEADLKKYAKKR